MKKLIALLLVLAMSLSLSSCSVVESIFDSFGSPSYSPSKNDKDDDDDDYKPEIITPEKALKSFIDDEHGGFYSYEGTNDGTSYVYDMYYNDDDEYFAIRFH